MVGKYLPECAHSHILVLKLKNTLIAKAHVHKKNPTTDAHKQMQMETEEHTFANLVYWKIYT